MSAVAATLSRLARRPTPRTRRYAAQQAALFAVAAWTHRHAPVASPPDEGEVDEALLREMRQRVRDLFAADLRDAEDGIYPEDVLFHRDVPRAAARWARLVWRRPRIVARREHRAWRDLPAHLDLSAWPPYYRRTFHWQDDGYLSARSAALYDVGVDVLFLGTADPMRRRVVRPIVEAVRAIGGRGRVVDVACGTGRTLRTLARALPSARLVGVDLSPPYLDEARRILAGRPDIRLLPGAAEALPLADGSMDVATSTWMFHELPPDVRRQAMSELARVTRPGGTVVVLDSCQHADSAALKPALRRFPQDFHEPYYAGYLDDPLPELAREAGLDVVDVSTHLLSVRVVAHKPA